MSDKGFWTNNAAGGDFGEPKRKYSWTLDFGKQGPDGLPHWAVKKTNKPQITIAEPTHQYLNHTFYFPGKVTWNTLEVTLVDPSSPDVSRALLQAIYKSGYHKPNTATDNVTTISKKGAVEALGGLLKLTQYDYTGRPIEIWNIHNAWISDVNFGDLAYDDDGNLVELTLKIRYDWADRADLPWPEK
jgi:hypothetical protein